MSLRVIVVDDHQIVQQGLQALLDTSPDYEVVGLANNGRAALELAASRQPDIAIVDVSMPELNGIDAVRRLLAIHPKLLVLGLSMHHEQRLITEMLEAGARAYLSKHSAFDELLTALEAVRAGRVYLGSGIDTDPIDTTSPLCRRHGLSPLSLREREVLQLLAEGKNTHEVAEVLNLGVKTIESHRRNCQVKLGLRGAAALTRYALRSGLTSLEI